VIWKRVSAYTPVEDASRIRILSERAKVEDPEVLTVPMFQEIDGVLPSIAVKTLYPGCRIAHD
jgi:hypothetical protein